MVLTSGDLIYASYPRKRDAINQPSILHDHAWNETERQQQQIWRRRMNEPGENSYLDITGQVKTLRKLGKRLDIELADGTAASGQEFGESSPGLLIAKIDDEPATPAS